MPIKIFSAAVAVALMLAFLAPVIIKMKEIPLAVILLIGIAMMLVDLWGSLQSTED